MILKIFQGKLEGPGRCYEMPGEREVGGGIGMGNTCKPMAVSFQCMTKFTTNKKKKKRKKKFLGEYASKFLAQAKVSSREEPGCHIPLGTGPCACRLKKTWGNEPGERNISTEG